MYRLGALLCALFFACAAPRELYPRAAFERAPVAPKHPRATTLHGQTRVDDYAWLRQKDSPEVLAYIRAEDAYTTEVMKPTEALQARLYREFLSRIKETDDTPPIRHGQYLYYTRTEQGKQYSILCRKAQSASAAEEVVLDLNQLAKGQSFLGLGTTEVSDDGALFAYSLDTTGFREYALHVKNLVTGVTLADHAEKTSSVAWAADNRTLFYVIDDDAKRPYRAYRHVLGSTEPDALVYEERDERFELVVYRSRSKRFVMLESASHTTSEARYLEASEPRAEPVLLSPRRDGREYYVDHRGDLFYIRTNDHGRNFRLVTADVAAPGEDNWQELVPPRDDVMLEDVEVFDGFYAMHERRDGVPRLLVHHFERDVTSEVELPETVREIYGQENPEPDQTRYRFSYESFTTPSTIYDYDVASAELVLVKRKPVLGGYDPARYRAERIHARASDGASIPISLVYKLGLPPGPRPMLLDGYGAYGYPNPTTFSYSRVSLLDRGVIYAIAHVRGGGELGKPWHDHGRMLEKHNTISDFVAAAELLVRSGYTRSDVLAIEGASAGGLLIGGALNERPQLFGAALLNVPFVDVLNTMSDPSLPLTVPEYEEWGNPQKPAEYRSIASYCPYTNIRARAYPAILVRTSYNDSQVMYWEPVKYTAKLRAHKTDHNPLLLWVNMQGGHGGSSGRYDQLHERAFDFAFLISHWAAKGFAGCTH